MGASATARRFAVALVVACSLSGLPLRQSAAVGIPDEGRPAIATGDSFSLVLKANGTVWAFGNNVYGQLGLPFNGDGERANWVPVQVPGITEATAIATGYLHSLVVGANGTVWSFGHPEFGRLGLGDTNGHFGPELVVGVTDAVGAAAGSRHSLVLRRGGTVLGFGDNSLGQLGVPITGDTSGVNPTPMPVQGLANVTAVAAGAAHSLALRSDGTVWAFGYNGGGQLGISTNSGSSLPNPTPMQVPGITGAIAIAAGASHSLVLRSDGTVWAFGTNTFGELGTTTNNDTSTANPTPTQVPGITGAIAIAAGPGFSLVLRNDGRVLSFGNNLAGELGNPIHITNSVPNPTPTLIPGITDAVAITANGSLGLGNGHSLVLRRDGTVLGFGYNRYGQLGTTINNGDPGPNPTPASAPGLLGIAASSDGAPLISMVPGRILESRPGAAPTIDRVSSGIGLRPAESITELQVAGRHGVPLTATSALLNVTVTEPVADGYLTLWPCGPQRPNASTINFVAGQTVANAVTVQIGTGGKVCIFAYAATHVVIDVDGYNQTGAAYVSLVPGRILESRSGVTATVDRFDSHIGKRPAGSVTELQVTGRHGVPASASAVTLNVTATEPEGAGYVTVWPCGVDPPNASTVNFAAGQTVANAVTAKIGVGGRVCLYAYVATHLVVDVTGYQPVGPTYTSLVPGRILETRSGVIPTVDRQSFGIGIRQAGSVTELQVTGRHGVPLGASSVVLNLTVTEPEGDGYITAWPCGTPKPETSNVNYSRGRTVSNAVTANIGESGKVCILTYAPAHLVVDVTGYHL